MQLCPSKHEAKLPSPESALDYFKIIDANLCLALGVASVKMGMTMVIEVHRNNNAQEAADRRHDRA